MNFKNKLILYAVLFVILLLISCSSNKTSQNTLSSHVSPNNCRINGTVVSIEEIREKTGHCSTEPCLAKVKINNVIETGSSFSKPLIKGDTIKIKFEFTLAETNKDLFPALNFVLPGLSSGDSFIGDVEFLKVIQLNSSTSPLEYRIFNYNKID